MGVVQTQQMVQGFGKMRGLTARFASGLAAGTRGLGAYGVALGGVAGAAGSFRTSLEIERQVAGLAKAADVGGEALEGLKRELFDVSTTTAGVALEDVFDFAITGGKLGIGAERLGEFARTMTMVGAAADDVPAAELADQLGKINSVLGLDQIRGLAQLGSAIDAVADSGVSSFADITSVMQRISGVGKVAGLSGDQMIAYAGALLDTGTMAELASTTLSRVFLGVNNLEGRAGFGKALGLSAEQFGRMVEADAMGAINAWLAAVGRMDAVAQQAAIGEALGSDAVQATAEIQKLAAQVGTIGNYAGIAADQFATLTQLQKSYDAVAGQNGATIQQLNNQLKITGDEIGTRLAPAIMTGTRLLGDLATGVTEAFSRLDGLTAGGAGGGFAAFFEDMGWGLRNMADIVEAWVTEATGWFATIPQNLGAVASWVGSSFLHAIHDGLNAAGAVVFNFVKNVAGVTQALARFAFRDTFEGFDFEWTPLLDRFEPTIPPPPEWATNPMGEAVEEVWQRINDREAARAAGQGVGAGLAEGVDAAGLGPGVASEVATGAAEGLQSGIEAGAKALGKSPILPGAGMAASLLAGSMLGGGLASAVSAALPTAAVGAAAEEIATGMDAARAAEAGPMAATRTTAANLELGSREAYAAIAAFRAGGQGQDRLLSVNNRQLGVLQRIDRGIQQMTGPALDVEAI